MNSDIPVVIFTVLLFMLLALYAYDVFTRSAVCPCPNCTKPSPDAPGADDELLPEMRHQD